MEECFWCNLYIREVLSSKQNKNSPHNYKICNVGWTGFWVIKSQQEIKPNVVEMGMSRWMSGHTWQDRIMNENIKEKIGVCRKDVRVSSYRRQ